MKAERDPVRVGALLRSLVSTRGWTKRLAVGRLRSGWARVVGEVLAARSEPVRLAAGVLTVRASPGAWASELALLAPRVAVKSDEFLGGGLVREVRVIAGGERPLDPTDHRGPADRPSG